MVGDSDEQEQANLQQEETLSSSMYTKLTALDEEVKILKKEFKHLLKTGKKLKKIIKTKELKNKAEITIMREMKQELSQESVNEIRHNTDRLKRDEQQESKLSKEEAIILQNMLNELHDTYKHGEDIINADKELYVMIKQLYDADLQDYQLEVSDINKK